VSASNISNLFYNEDNEWYKTTDALNNVNTITWDAAGNMLGNNGFGGPNPLTVSYNAREQTATQTDTSQHVSPMTFTGQGQWERVSDTDTNGTHTYTYSLLGLTKVVGSTASYVRDPGGSLISQQPASGGPYYYLSDGQGSVAGMVDTSGGQAAGYFYCPTGNAADPAWGSAAGGNPYQYDSAYYDASFQSYWMGGQQIDANSGNAFSLNNAPDTVQGNFTASGSYPSTYSNVFGMETQITLNWQVTYGQNAATGNWVITDEAVMYQQEWNNSLGLPLTHVVALYVAEPGGTAIGVSPPEPNVWYNNIGVQVEGSNVSAGAEIGFVSTPATFANPTEHYNSTFVIVP
jgi:hypothetical protein